MAFDTASRSMIFVDVTKIVVSFVRYIFNLRTSFVTRLIRSLVIVITLTLPLDFAMKYRET